MSQGLVCDACGEPLLLESDVRYVVRIRGVAAYDPLEITREDLDRDHEGDMARLLDEMASRDPGELEDGVHKEWTLDLCSRCWRAFRVDPLADLRARLRDPPPEGGDPE